MPVPFALITTIGEASEYALGSYNTAKSGCPKTAADYYGVYQNIESFIKHEVQGNRNEFAGVAQYKADIAAVDQKCKYEKANKVPVSTPAAAASAAQADPGVSITPVQAGGLGLGAILAGLGIGYLLLSKKKR